MTLNEHVLVVVREPQRVTLLNTSSVDFTGFTALPRDHPTAPEHRRLICWFADTDVKPPGFSNVERGQRTEVNGESTSMMWPILGSRTAKEQNRTFETRINILSARP